MIVSHEHRFIFIKTRKTAGTSVELFLARVAGADAVVTPFAEPEPAHVPHNHQGLFNPMPELVAARRLDTALDRRRESGRALRDVLARRRYSEHLPARAVRARLGKRTWDRYFTFCFERDPWEKVFSLYAQFNQMRRQGQSPAPFDEWLRRYRDELPVDWPTYSIDGAIGVDFVGRYEALESQLRHALDEIGLDAEVDLPHAKSGVRGADPSPGDGSDALIAELFAREIHVFGYPVRGGAAPREA